LDSSRATRYEPKGSPFLTARWLDLILVNYSCPADLLKPLVPEGTALDLWQGEAVISLVGFLFADTRIMGVRIPRHTTFEEVNLRFYVCRTAPSGELRRAVVFVRELVPRWAIATGARLIYNEPYLSVPMSRRSTLTADEGGSVSYAWSFRGERFVLAAEASGPARRPPPGSEAEFITEHYWGYTRQPDGGTLEYHVEHPAWLTWEAASAGISGPVSALYGPAFGDALSRPARSAFVAVGSEVSVHRGSSLAGSRAGCRLR
jgi:uncharacterized protein YqjF (DUF2071 family)